jgi:hypothetical protein
MATLEKPNAKILDFKVSLKHANQITDSIFTELGINFEKELIDIKLEQLKCPPYHSRIPIENRLKSLMDSLETYGFLGGIFVSSRNYNIIDGWYRKGHLHCGNGSGWPSAPVYHEIPASSTMSSSIPRLLPSLPVLRLPVQQS